MNKGTSEIPDDLEAVRSIVNALEKFQPSDQKRILRWVQEKIGLEVTTGKAGAPPQEAERRDHVQGLGAAGLDIKTFIEKKNPASDAQFTAAVAYYHKFEAPTGARKESITADDLQDACRKVGRNRMNRPAQTLVNAHQQGLLDRGERGSYTLSTVGENLVAVALPSEGSVPRSRAGGKRKKKGKKESRKTIRKKKTR